MPSRGSRGRGIRPGTLLFLFFVPLLGGAIYAHARMSAQPLWSVRSIEIIGNRSLSTPELLDQLGLRPGIPWWTVWRNGAARVRSGEPRIRTLSLAWRWPRDLVVRVRERESRLRLLSQPPMELAPDGMILAPQPALDPADLPLMTGALPADLLPGRFLEFPAVGPHWHELLELKDTSPELWKSISEIHYAGGADFQIILRSGRRMILWQPGINEDLKERIPGILADLGRDNVDDAVLDLRFREQLVVRRPVSALSDTAMAASTELNPSQRQTGGALGSPAPKIGPTPSKHADPVPQPRIGNGRSRNGPPKRHSGRSDAKGIRSDGRRGA